MRALQARGLATASCSQSSSAAGTLAHPLQRRQQQQPHCVARRRIQPAAATPPSGVCAVELAAPEQVHKHHQHHAQQQPAAADNAVQLHQQHPEVFSAEDFHARFTLTGEVLGQGTYGTVRACTDSVTGQQLAVKILPKKKLGEDRSSSVAREVAIWKQLSAASPATIVGLLGAYEDASNIYLVQELMTGGDLQSVIDEQGVLDERVAASVLRGVLEALTACHAADVCYGDVKPANFMLAHLYPSMAHRMDPAVAPPGEVQIKAIDFGCAQHCPDGCQVLQGLSGTPVFIAPEVISQHCYSMAMDVWSAGVLAYHMLSGQFPFWDTNLAGLSRLHPRRVIENVRDMPVLWDVPAIQRLSPDARHLLRGMLSKDPDTRISAAEALQHPWLQQQ